mmetsp:Transcript_81078/g.211567  ORF Transcript_81078/g.211567 Transcript_81078/m.211567 type:complete len:250 (+) Transcript_81078:154-903(+)
MHDASPQGHGLGQRHGLVGLVRARGLQDDGRRDPLHVGHRNGGLHGHRQHLRRGVDGSRGEHAVRDLTVRDLEPRQARHRQHPRHQPRVARQAAGGLRPLLGLLRRLRLRQHGLGLLFLVECLHLPGSSGGVPGRPASALRLEQGRDQQHRATQDEGHERRPDPPGHAALGADGGRGRHRGAEHHIRGVRLARVRADVGAGREALVEGRLKLDEGGAALALRRGHPHRGGVVAFGGHPRNNRVHVGGLV